MTLVFQHALQLQEIQCLPDTSSSGDALCLFKVR
jgi:hypothetical protein